LTGEKTNIVREGVTLLRPSASPSSGTASCRPSLAATDHMNWRLALVLLALVAVDVVVTMLLGRPVPW